MKLTYPGPVNSVLIPALGRDVAQGETVDVKDPALADQLVAQGWSADGAPAAETVDGILAAVGDDADSAAVALAAEQAKPNPRTTLIAGLQRVIDEAPTQPADEADTKKDTD